MKTRGWTRVLSTLLTIAMIATLLVVPASATAVTDSGTFTFDPTKLTAEANLEKVTSTEYDNLFDGYFSYWSSKPTDTGDNYATRKLVEGDNVTAVIVPKNMQSGVSFTVTGTAKVTISFGGYGGSNSIPALGAKSGAALSETDQIETTATSTGKRNTQLKNPTPTTDYVYELKAGTYYVGNARSSNFSTIHKIVVVQDSGKPAENERSITFTVPEGITVSDVAVGETARDFTATKETKVLNADKTQAVTFKAKSATGYTLSAVKVGDDTITPTSEGVYTIPASNDAQTVTFEVTSSINHAASITLNQDTMDVVMDTTQTLTATVTAVDTAKPCDDTVKFTGSNDKIATVDESTGVITPVAVGAVDITATAGDVSKTCKVNVVVADGNVFESKNLAAATFSAATEVKYNNTFSVMATDKIPFENDGTQRSWTDTGSEYTSTKNTPRLKVQAAVSTASGIQVKTTQAAAIKVWGTAGGSGTRQIKLIDAEGAQVGSLGGIASGASSNDPFCSTFTVDKAGTYYVGGASSSTVNLYKIEVIAQAAVTSIALDHGYHEGDTSKGRGHTIYVGGTEQGSKDNFNEDGTEDEMTYPGSWKMNATILPAGANQAVTWGVPASAGADYPIKVDQNGVVTINQDAIATMNFANAVGTVTATAAGDTSKIAYCDVIVLPKINAVKITDKTKTTLTMGGEPLQLGAELELAGDVKVSQLTDNQSKITWSVREQDNPAVSVDQTGKVTALHNGTATVVASRKALSVRATDKEDKLTVTVNPGTLNMTLTADSADHGAAESTAVLTVGGIEDEAKLENVTVTCSDTNITVTQDASNKAKWTATLPANTSNTDPVTYTFTAKYTGTGDWTAEDATCTVTKAAQGVSVITTNPAANKEDLVVGESLTLSANAKLDGAESNDLTYQWQKGGVDITDATGATYTISSVALTDAGSYTVVVKGGGATDHTSRPITITIKNPPLQRISVAQDGTVDGVAYTAGTPNTLVINGKKTVKFNVTMTPAANDDTLTTDLEIVNGLALVDCSYENGVLTITPQRSSVDENVPRKLTLKGTKNTDAKWEVNITVKKLPAPAMLDTANVTATAPTTAQGGGTIVIANTTAGHTYRIKAVPTTGSEDDANQDSTGWTDVEATGATTTFTNVAPGTYMVREKVADPAFQNISGSVKVTVGNYVAPSHTVSIDDDLTNGELTLSETEVQEGNAVVVTVQPYTGYKLEKLWYVKAGESTENAITKTNGAYSFTMPTTDVTIYATFVEGTATNPKVHTFGEVTGLADIIGTAADYTTGQNGTGFIKITNSKMVGTEKTDADGNSVAGYYFKGVRSLTASKPTAADRTMTMTAPEAGGKFTLYVNNNAQGKNAKAGGVKVVKGSETVDTIDIPVGVGVYTVDAATAGDYDLTGTLVTEAYPFIYAVVWTPAGYADHTGHTVSDKWTEMTDLATTATCQKKATKSYYCNADPVCFVTRTEEVGELADHHYVDGVCEWCGTAQTGGGALTDITVSTETVTVEANKTVTVTVKKDPLAADDTLKIKAAPAAATATATLENGVLTIKGVAVGETSVVLSGTTAESVTKTITIKVNPQTSYTFDGEVDLKDEAAGADLAGKKYADDMIEGVGAGKITAQGTYAKLAKKKAGYFKVTIPEGKTATITIVASTNSSDADKKLDLGLYTSSWTAVPEKNGVTQLTGGTGVKTTLVYENVAAGTYNIGAVTSGDTDGRVYSVDIKLDGGEEPGPEPTTKYAVTVIGGKTNKAEAAEGEEVTVSATRPAGKAFDKWTSEDLTLSEADAVKNPLTFTMPAKAVTITATFKDLVLEEGEYAISVDTEIVNGSVNVDKPKAKEGDTVTVIVTPATGYELEAITVNGKAIDGTTFTMPGEAVTVSATFKKTGGEDPNPPTPGEDTYTITCDTAVNGTVTADKAKAKAGDTVTLTVKAAEGYELDTLTVNGKAITGTTFTMPGENVTVKATFKKTGGDEPTPPTPTEVDKTKLEAALAAAKAIDPASVETSADGKDVATTKTWVTQAVKDALAKAIADAEALAADADQAAVDAAAKALEDAVAAWAPKAGTKRTFSGGGGSSSSSSSNTGKVVASVTNPAGGKTTVKKDHEGNVTITATDDKGEVIAEVKLPATAPSVGYKFVDVPEGHWAEKAINDMAGLELVKGVNEADHLFDMVSPITRGSVATILSRLANGKADVTDVFSDVAEGQWFADGVAWAAKAGVVTGFENGTFQPDGSITREQLAVMLARYAKLLGLDTDAAIGELAVFNDAESVQSWAREGMAWCVKVGIIQGRGDNSVDPGANATRAEAAVMLARLVDLLK